MSILGSLIGGAFSLFSASKQRSQAKEDAANKFIDLRASALAGGFNPLTALQATGGAGFGAYPSSAPPLASIEFLTGAADGIVDEVSGAADLRRATDRLNFDLAALKLDQARSGVVLPPPPSAVAAFGASPLGALPVTVAQSNVGVTDAGVDPSDAADIAAAGGSPREQRLTPIDLFVPYRMRDGSIGFGPNPSVMDAEQFAAALALWGAVEAKQALGLRGDGDGAASPAGPSPLSFGGPGPLRYVPKKSDFSGFAVSALPTLRLRYVPKKSDFSGFSWPSMTLPSPF